MDYSKMSKKRLNDKLAKIQEQFAKQQHIVLNLGYKKIMPNIKRLTKLASTGKPIGDLQARKLITATGELMQRHVKEYYKMKLIEEEIFRLKKVIDPGYEKPSFPFGIGMII